MRTSSQSLVRAEDQERALMGGSLSEERGRERDEDFLVRAPGRMSVEAENERVC